MVLSVRTHLTLPETAAKTKENNAYKYVSRRAERGRAVKEDKEKKKKAEK